MTLFFTEMWERFTYYGIRALLILFMTAKIADGGLGFGTEKAAPVYAMFTSLAYLATVPGGWIADNFLGQRRSVLCGGILITLGNSLMVLHGAAPFFGGLLCIVLGIGMLKPNVSVIVGQLYTPEDKRRDAGFSIFYIGINVGAGSAPLVCGYLAQHESWKGVLSGWGLDPTGSWHWGFGAAAVGMALGVLQYVLTGRALGTAGLHPTAPANEDVARKNRRTLAIGVGGVAALGIALFVFDRTAHHYDKFRWDPKDSGLAIEVSTSDGSEPAAMLAGGAEIAADDLETALGSDALHALQREVFRQRVAAGKAAGRAEKVFLRVRAPGGPEDSEPIRVYGIQWVDVPGGVRVSGTPVDDKTREIPLLDLQAAAIDGDLPKEQKPLTEARDGVLTTVLADAVAAGATRGALSGPGIKVGGLNAGNINTGFTIALALLIVAFFARLFLAGHWTPSERARLITIFVLFCGASVFWGIFEQAGSTLNLFADRSTRNSIFGLKFPSSWWQSVNAVLIVLLAPLFAWLWIRLGKRKRDPSPPAKFSIGLLFAGLGFLLLVGGATFASGWREVSPLWLFGVYLLHTIGELCLSPVGLSSMTKLAPARVLSLMMGVWFLAASLGNFLGGQAASFYESLPLPQLFGWVGATGVVMSLVMFALVIPIKRMMARVESAGPTGKA